MMDLIIQTSWFVRYDASQSVDERTQSPSATQLLIHAAKSKRNMMNLLKAK